MTSLRIEDDLGIPMPDGVRLSARGWFPDTPAPVPAILEMIPYRKRDVTAPRDATNHPHFAAAGYAVLRVDLRGCGESEGLFDDEYSVQELQDVKATIEWIAAQGWCTGKVGIMGISWGGFNGLQVAALRPAGLAAVITACSSVDRYADDIHFKGGCILGENIGWAANVMARFALPPDPALRPDWRSIWLERLQATTLLAEPWHAHRDRDAYWKHGSVIETPEAIDVPVLSIGGWHDGYRNTPHKLLRLLPGLCHALVGPWNHKYPNLGTPGPRLDFVGEALRWWDRWLKDRPNGVEDDPAQRLWLMESAAPDRAAATRPGRWIGLPADGGDHIAQRVLSLSGTGLVPDPGPRPSDVPRSIAPDPACGMQTGEFFPFGFPAGDLPGDQAPDDARSLCYETAPLENRLEIVGGPVLRLRLTADRPTAQVAARLSDVRPDGTVLLLTHGFLDLRYRDGFDAGVAVTPGAVMEVTIPLDQMASAVPAGHRLRLAISPTYWPFIWPGPDPAVLTVHGGSLEIPELTGPGLPVAPFDPPRDHVPCTEQTIPGAASRIDTIEGGRHVQRLILDGGRVTNREHGLWNEERLEETWRIAQADAGQADVTFVWTKGLGRDDWAVGAACTTRMQTRADGYEISAHLTAHENGNEVFARVFSAFVPL